MSHFRVGGVYNAVHAGRIRCTRRWFDGELELVEFVYVEALASVGGEAVTVLVPWSRTARVIADQVHPRVDSLGGVLRSDMCDHRYARRVTAHGGPNHGRRCCELCGGFVGRLRVLVPNPCHGPKPFYAPGEPVYRST